MGFTAETQRAQRNAGWCVVRINPRKINELDATKAFTANSSYRQGAAGAGIGMLATKMEERFS